MTARDDEDDEDTLGWLDALAQSAGDATPPPMDPDDGARRVARAMTEAAARRVAQATRRTVWSFAIAAVALVALAGVGAASVIAAGTREETPLFVSLPTGDRMTATGGARFRMVELDARARGVVVDEGTVLFDVRALRDGERFEVTSGRTKVRVRGTVFSVRRVGDAAEVQVYEGRVEVSEGDRRWALGAGRRLRDGSESTLDADAPLAREGLEAAEARRRSEPIAALSSTASTADVARVGGTLADRGAVAGSTTTATDPTGATRERPTTTSTTAARSSATTTREEHERTTEHELAPADVRRWIATGETERALAMARGRSGGVWRMIEADALRALGRHEDAADTYDRAARELGGSARAQAGYLAATLRRDRLGDAAGALRSLESSGAADPGSPLEERALALSARILASSGRRDAARDAAERYLARFPSGGRRDAMQRIVTPPPDRAADDAGVASP